MSEFVLCVQNEGCEDTLEPLRLYQLCPTKEAESKRGYLRIIDDSGEDYLYPARCFVPIVLPPEVLRILPTRA